MCALWEPLGDIMCELYYYNYYLLWRFFVFFSEPIFPKNCIIFFCILEQENQEGFSESCSLISGVLQGLVRISKKYMEVNLFLLLSWSTCMQCIVFLISLVEGNLLEWGQLFSSEILWSVSNFPGGQFSLRGNCPDTYLLVVYGPKVHLAFTFLVKVTF